MKCGLPLLEVGRAEARFVSTAWLGEEIVRVAQTEAFMRPIWASGSVQCWGFPPNGRQRHPMWMGWEPSAP